jgi:hypothetical protein
MPLPESSDYWDPRQHDGRLPGLTVQREVLTFELQAQIMGTLAIDTSTDCLTLRTPVGTAVGTEYRLVDVAWPLGWYVAIRDEAVSLIDAAGHTAARLGDETFVGGGFLTPEQAKVISCMGQERVFQASGALRPVNKA